MPNWVYNTLRVKGTKKRLTQFAWSIGSPDAAVDWKKLVTVIPNTWDSRDERSTGELEVDGRDLVYRFDTAWNPRPQMIEDLAAQYPDLRFELHYVEEGPAFAGAAVFDQGRKVGEAFLGDGEERAFFEPYDEDEYDGEWDYDGMTQSLLVRARAGETIDWEARRQRATQARESAEQQVATQASEQLQQAVARIQADPKLRENPQRRNEILIPLASRTGAGLTAIPKAWWNDDLLVAFLLEHAEQAKLIPASKCTETLVDKLLAVERRGYAGLYPLAYLKIGLRHERQALAYVKQAPGALGQVPRALRTAKVCEQAVRGDGAALKHVPRALRTPALCDLAVTNKGAALEFVPAALKTVALCTKAVRPTEPNALKFVPAKFLNGALVEVALNNTHSWIRLELGSVNSVALRRKYLMQIIAKDGWSSIKVMTEREHEQAWGTREGRDLLCKLLEDDQIGLLDEIPTRFHTPEVLAAAGQHSGLANFKFIPEKYKTRALCREAIENDFWGGRVLQHVPPKLRDRSLCVLSLDQALSGSANTYRTEGFPSDLFAWFKANEANCDAASARAHLSSGFVESEIPDSVWNEALAARSIASSPYAVLFVPRRYVRDEALVTLLQDHFGMYLLMEESVAREIAPQAAVVLRDFVGERAWRASAPCQALEQALQPSARETLAKALEQQAKNWIKWQFFGQILAQAMVIEGDSTELSTAMLSSLCPGQQNVQQAVAQMFPQWPGRGALSAHECHRLLMACNLAAATA